MAQGNGATEIKVTDMRDSDKIDIILEVLAQLQEKLEEIDERLSNLSIDNSGYSEIDE